MLTLGLLLHVCWGLLLPHGLCHTALTPPPPTHTHHTPLPPAHIHAHSLSLFFQYNHLETHTHMHTVCTPPPPLQERVSAWSGVPASSTATNTPMTAAHANTPAAVAAMAAAAAAAAAAARAGGGPAAAAAAAAGGMLQEGGPFRAGLREALGPVPAGLGPDSVGQQTTYPAIAPGGVPSLFNAAAAAAGDQVRRGSNAQGQWDIY